MNTNALFCFLYLLYGGYAVNDTINEMNGRFAVLKNPAGELNGR